MTELTTMEVSGMAVFALKLELLMITYRKTIPCRRVISMMLLLKRQIEYLPPKRVSSESINLVSSLRIEGNQTNHIADDKGSKISSYNGNQ